MFGFTNQGLNFALSTYFNTYLWGLPASWLAIFTLCVILGVVLALLTAGVTSRLWGKRRAAVAASLGYIVLATAPLLLRSVGAFPGNDNPILLPLLMADVVFAVTMLVCAAILRGLFLSGAILTGVGFPTGAVPGHVPAEVLQRLSLTYCGLTAVIGLIAALVLSRFPLSEADHEQRLQELAETISHVAPLPGSEAEVPG